MLWLMRCLHCLSETIHGESIISLAKCCQRTVRTTLTLLCISLKLGGLFGTAHIASQQTMYMNLCCVPWPGPAWLAIPSLCRPV